MAGWFSYSLSDEILNYIFRGVPISIGGSLWMRLLVAPSSRAGGGTETNYAGYARLQMPRDATVFTAAPSNGQLSNGVVLAFPTANSAGNGQLMWFDFVDTSSGAFNKLYPGGPVTPARSIVVNKPPKFRVGSLVITS